MKFEFKYRFFCFHRSVRRLNPREDYSSLPVDTFGVESKLSGACYSSCNEISNKQEENESFDLLTVKSLDGTDIILKTVAKRDKNIVDGAKNSILEHTLTSKTSEETDITSQSHENNYNRNRYVGRSAVEYSPQSRIKWANCSASSDSRRKRSYDTRPFSVIDSSQILLEESQKEAERRERRASLWETKYDRKNSQHSLELLANQQSLEISPAQRTSEQIELPRGDSPISSENLKS